MKIHKKDGSPILCKFCKKPIAVDYNSRIYELDQETLHVVNCERRKAFFKSQAINNAQIRREKNE